MHNVPAEISTAKQQGSKNPRVTMFQIHQEVSYMKALRIMVLAILAISVFASMCFAKVDKINIINGPHDLRYGGGFNAKGGTDINAVSGTWVAATYTLCNFCHIAHKFAIDNPATAPGELLWNHQLSTQTFTNYQSVYMTATTTPIDPSNLDNPSALCLSCHDGTVAINANYAAVTGGTVNPVQIGALASGQYQINPGDQNKQHPINFAYTAALASQNGMLKSPASASAVDANGEIPLYTVGGVASTMQCATCHEPHQNAGILTRDFKTAAGAARATTPGWSWCLYCHSQSQT